MEEAHLQAPGVESDDGVGTMTKVLVVGFPRSGTNLLHRMLENYLSTDERPARVAKIHWRYQLAGFAAQSPAVVHIVRDPRDTAVSGYYYYMQYFGEKYSHTFENHSLLQFLETGFSQGFDGQTGWPRGWKEHIDHWWRRPDIAHTAYESLMHSGPSEIMRLGEELVGTKPDWRKALWASVVAKRVDNIRPAYIPQAGWHLKPKMDRPKVGEWTSHFGIRETEFISQYCGGLITGMGYTERIESE